MNNSSRFLSITVRKSCNFIEYVRNVLSLLKLKPFDTTNAEGRGKERHRRIIWTAIASFFAKCIGIFTTFISIPLTINYLGQERYGLWLTISSFFTMISFFDLGVGNGLLNVISQASGKGERESIKIYISSSLFIMVITSLVLLIVFLVIYSFVNWSDLFNVASDLAASEADITVLVFAVFFLINIPLNIVQKIQIAYQEGFRNGIWQAIGNIASLLALVIVIYFRAGLPWLVFSTAAMPTLFTLLNGINVFFRRYPWMKPSLRYIEKQFVWRLLRISMLFLALQIASAVGYQSDNIVIARILGAKIVPQYAVPMRLFALIPMILGFVIAPLWPAYSEAIVRKDTQWVKKTLKRSIYLSLIVSIPAVLLLQAFIGDIIQFWVGSAIIPSISLRVGLGAWSVLASVGGCWAMLLNGANVIKFQIICIFLMGVLNITLSIVLTSVIGVSGVVYGTLISQFICVSMPSIYYIPRLIKRMEIPKNMS